jgi:hypothetical protein
MKFKPDQIVKFKGWLPGGTTGRGNSVIRPDTKIGTPFTIERYTHTGEINFVAVKEDPNWRYAETIFE